jgi:hypothetical protein
MSAGARRGALLLGVLALAGCGQPPPPSVFPTAEAALGRMRSSYACADGVQGTAKLDVFSPRGRVRGETYLLALLPERVRFDVVSAFGVTLYTLTSDGRDFKMLDLEQKQFLEGPAKPCNLARLTQIPVPGHALVSLLRGEAPVLVHAPGSGQIQWSDSGYYRVLLTGEHQAREEIRLRVHPDDWLKPYGEQRVRVSRVLVSQAGRDLYEVELGEHRAVATASPRLDEDGLDDPIPPSGPSCDAELPHRIRMRVPHTSDDVLLEYSEARWNPPLLDGSFTQPQPGGTKRVFVDCAR